MEQVATKKTRAKKPLTPEQQIQEQRIRSAWETRFPSVPLSAEHLTQARKRWSPLGLNLLAESLEVTAKKLPEPHEEGKIYAYTTVVLWNKQRWAAAEEMRAHEKQAWEAERKHSESLLKTFDLPTYLAANPALTRKFLTRKLRQEFGMSDHVFDTLVEKAGNKVMRKTKNDGGKGAYRYYAAAPTISATETVPVTLKRRQHKEETTCNDK